MKLFRTFSKNSPSQDMTPSFVTFVMLPSRILLPGEEKIFLSPSSKNCRKHPFSHMTIASPKTTICTRFPALQPPFSAI